MIDRDYVNEGWGPEDAHYGWETDLAVSLARDPAVLAAVLAAIEAESPGALLAASGTGERPLRDDRELRAAVDEWAAATSASRSAFTADLVARVAARYVAGGRR